MMDVVLSLLTLVSYIGLFGPAASFPSHCEGETIDGSFLLNPMQMLRELVAWFHL